MSEPAPRLSRLPFVLGAIALFIVLLPGAAEFLIDQRWFESLGQAQVFSGIWRAKLTLGVCVGMLFGGSVLLNGWLAIRRTPHVPRAFVKSGWDMSELHGFAKRIPVPMSVVMATLAGITGSGAWEVYLHYRHATEFGVADPLFGQDIGFFIFVLPALQHVHVMFLWVIGVTTATTMAVYGLRGAVHSFTGRLYISGAARSHLLALGSALLLNVAFGAWLHSRELVFSTIGPVAGASFTDVHALLPGYRIEVGVAIFAAGLAVFSAVRSTLRPAALGVALLAATHLLGVIAYPGAIHRFSVLPNEAEREAPFIERNIEATLAAYGLDSVEERDLSAEAQLSRADIDANQATIANVRLWDHQPLLDTFAQIQEIRTYYEFASVDNDRYIIDGQLRQTMLSARELSTSSLPHRTWINEHFTFTHGYGLTLGPVNETTEEGLPKLFIQDIPPVSMHEGIEVRRPEIYFGELTTNHVFVNTAAQEFDHPSGEASEYTHYEGEAGVVLSTLTTRLLLALYLRSAKLLLSNDIRPDSRVLLHRQVMSRVRHIAPFLDYDSDPYLVVRDDGGLSWIVDAYTTSHNYPYAQRSAGGINYIRNAVKVVVDAYDGTVTFYVNEPEDPIVRMWDRAFPELFTDMAEMPTDLQAHLRYPEDLFRLQADAFCLYHMRAAEDVYNREDQWQTPAVSSGGIETPMEPYYTVMRLPGEEEEEFILMLPYTPASKENLAAWMVARSDGEHRGELVIYRFPKDRLVFGPQQIMNRIHQDAEISRQVSLWDQRGSQAIFGTLLVIPIEESLIYVAPLYLRSDGGQIPELKRVIAVYGNAIAMDLTLDAALATIFEQPSSDAVPSVVADATENPATGPMDSDAAELALGNRDPRLAAQAAFLRASEAQQRGDWASYGEHLRELGALLERLAREANEQGATLELGLEAVPVIPVVPAVDDPATEEDSGTSHHEREVTEHAAENQ